jgi:capsular exopolysaccharide synthesis family protein
MEYYPDLLSQETLTFRDYLGILRSRKWWLLGTLAGVLLLTGIFCLVVTPVYRASTVIQITQDNPGPQLGDSDPLAAIRGGADLSKFQETQNRILASRALAWRLIESLNLADHPDFQEVSKQPDLTPEKRKNDLIDLFLKKLEIKPVKDSFLVEVSFLSSDQSLAQKVANALPREYVQLAIDSRSQSFVIVREWLEKQLEQMGQRLQASTRKLFDYSRKADIFVMEDLGGKDTVLFQKYVELGGLLTKAQSERLAKEAIYRQLKEKGPDASPITNHPLIAQLRQEYVAQNAKVASLARIYLPGHPEMQAETAKLQELSSRLAAEVKRLQESARADYEAASRAEKLLSEAFETHKQQLAHLQDSLIDFQMLKRDTQTTEKLYQALLARMGETTVASTMVASNVAVIDPADLPVEPHFPKTLLFLALAGVIGLGGGIGAAFLAEYLDDTLKTSEEAERICQTPILGVVPLAPGEKALPGPGLTDRLLAHLPFFRSPCPPGVGEAEGQADLVVVGQPRSPVSEAVRHLRTSLMLSASGQPPRTLVITSPNPREGKSTISLNLAASLALGQRRTILLDCDLRRPRLHQAFKLPSQPGLTNYLTGSAALEEIILPTPVENLWFVPAGPVPPNPAELLQSPRFRTLLAHLQQEYHHLLLDTPPVLGFSDARVVAALADGVLLVVKHQGTSRASGRLARQLFARAQAPLLGLVLNQVQPNGLGRNGHYHQGYYDLYYGDSPGETRASAGR